MLLWIAMAVLTAAASLAVLIPLGRQTRALGTESQSASIYRDQLDELTRDRERGLIGEAEAEAARIEIARRLLKSDAENHAEPAATVRGRKLALVTAILLLPLVSIGTYLAIGSPQLADQPFAERSAASGPSELDQMVRKVEAHLAQQPEDGQGWEVIAPIYARLGRNDDAVRAFDNARRILGATSDREALYGEAVTRAHGGLVTADARAAFDRALAQDKGNVRARFYMAMALGQSGQTQPAIAAWRSLIDGAPSDATWLPIAQTELATLEGRPSPAMQANAPGPTAAQVAATAGQTPEERQQMIEGMVSGLAAKLAATPDDTEGWARLFRAYMVMGRTADAEAAYGRAKTALAAKPDLLAAIEKAARDNGIVKD